MKVRDEEIQALVDERNRIEQEKIEMNKQMDAIKTQ